MDELIQRARDGDTEAWRELYESLAGRLVVWLRARPSGDPSADAEDLAAEAWLVAAERLSTFHGDRDAFAGWLFGIARNLALNVQRRSSRRATDAVAVQDSPDLWGAVDGVADGVGEIDWVRRQLASLPVREGEVLACLLVVGLDTGQTAEALGISTTAVRVARHRGIAKLRRLVPAT